MLIIFVTLAILLLIAYHYLRWNYDYWQVRGVPFEKPKIYFGNFKESMMRRHHVSEDFSRLYYQFKGIANFIGIFQMREPRLVIINPTLVNEILIKKFHHFKDNEFSRIFNPKVDPLFKRNPYLARGDCWIEYRSEIATAFSSSRMMAMYPIMKIICEKMYIQIVNHIDRSFEARELALRYTADIVGNCIFNIETESLSTRNCDIKRMTKRLASPPMRTIFFMIFTEIFPALRSFLPIKFISSDVEQFFLNFFERSMRRRKLNNFKSNDFLDYVISLREKKKLSHEDIAGHLTTFFSDGLETTSLLLAHILYELANNECVQGKLRKEINQYFEVYEDNISYEILNEMSYLELIVNETLRLHPPFTLISKQCTSNIELEITNGEKRLIEKGMNIYIPVYQLQTDPEYFPKPKEFIPERYAKLSSAKGVYLPFGNGARQCLGMKFASIVCKAAVVELVKDFKISVNKKTSDNLEIDPNEFLNVKKGGMWLDFKPVQMFKI